MHHVGADLAAPTDVLFLGVHSVYFSLFFLQFHLVQPRAQDFHGLVFIPVLAAFVLALHDDSGRFVRETHGATGLVDVLAARPAGPVGIDAQIFFIDLHFDIVIQVGVDKNAGETGVPALIGIEGADAHQSVNAVFRFEQAVGILAADFHRCTFNPSLFGGKLVNQVGRETSTLGIAQIHPQQHGSPIGCFGTARAGVNLQNGVRRIGLFGKEHFQLHDLQHFLGLTDFLFQFDDQLFVFAFYH